MHTGINQTGSVNTYGANGINAVEVYGGTVSQNLTMKNNGIPYVITSSINVYSASGPTLTIEAGVVVKFNQYTALYIGYGATPGALFAVGTAAAPILFTSSKATPTPGDWYGIILSSAASGASDIEYVTVEYGGAGANYSNADLTINASNASAPVLRNCIIRNSAGSGIYLSGASGYPVVIDSELSGNKWGIYSSSSNLYVTNTKITGNTTAGVWNASTVPDVDARDNWWGAPTGPTYSGNPKGTGDKISDHVNYNPWLGQAPGTILSITGARALPSSLNPDGGYLTVTAAISSSANWTISVTDANNNAVRTFTGTGTAISQKWYGENDQSVKVADGAYYYQISAVANGNTASTPQGMIVVSRQLPIAIMDVPSDNQMFPCSTINITGTAADNASFKSYTLDYGVGENPASWTTLETATTPVTNGLLYAWNTSSLTGAQYTLRLTVANNAGNVIVLPARVRFLCIQNAAASEPYISPNGDGIKDTTVVSASITYQSNWTITIKNASGGAVRTFTGTAASIAQAWDGKDGTGTVVPDGSYTYQIDATSTETNIAATSITGTITVDVTAPMAIITAPVANAVFHNIVPIAGTATDTNFDTYRVEYGPAAGNGPWTTINAASASVNGGALASWVTNDGTNAVLVQNGGYIIRLSVFDKAGNSSATTVPVSTDNLILSNISASGNTINTNASQTSSISFTINEPATVTLKIVPEKQGPAGTPIYQIVQTVSVAGASSFTWDGKDSTAKVVPDEAYLYTLEATDGTKTDSYNPPQPAGTGSVICSQSAYDPYKNIPTTISYAVTQPERIKISITGGQSPITVMDSVPHAPGSYTIAWNGRNSNGNVLTTGTAQCSVSSLLRENYIITSGDTPVVSSVITDPYMIQFSYGQFTRIKYNLSRDAVVTVKLISPLGATFTIVNGQAQAAGPQELEWNGIDQADTTGKRIISSDEGDYTLSIQAVNPLTGASSVSMGNLTIAN